MAERLPSTLRDFGTTPDLWSETFLNYTMVMSDFFGVALPSLVRVLLLFHNKIKALSEIYEWQGAVLPLAIDFHTEITRGDHTNVAAWTMHRQWIDE